MITEEQQRRANDVFIYGFPIYQGNFAENSGVDEFILDGVWYKFHWEWGRNKDGSPSFMKLTQYEEMPCRMMK